MDVTSMPTDELDRLLHELLAADPVDMQADLIRAISQELRNREPEPTPEELQAFRARLKGTAFLQELEQE